MRQATEELATVVPVRKACESLGYPRSTLYRSRQARPVSAKPPRPTPPRALSQGEQETVRAVLNSERFQDDSPRQVYATLLDEGVYHCSIRTMYRILHEHDELHERRHQRQHPTYAKPELLATDPNQLWSWDITKLRAAAKWTYYYLYVILDVYSRYVVGWLIAEHESADLAQQLIETSCHKQQIQPGQLTLHSDRGAVMTAKSVAQLLDDLGVTKTHSRPYNANAGTLWVPFSEAQFKTLKYRPDYPGALRAPFGSVADARSWAHAFFAWYNHQHHHTGLGLLTPATVHLGQVAQVTAQRQNTLRTAYNLHPQRFVKGAPMPPQPPDAVWINPPKSDFDTPFRV